MKSASAAFFSLMMAAACTAVAENIGNMPNVSLSGGSYAVSTETLTSLPSDMPQPMFWLDASQTNAWTFVGEADADGRKISVAPSLVGVNALQYDSGTVAYADRDYARLAPSAALGGKNVIDFGPVGSKRSLWFSSVDGAGKPLLENMGTVVAVYDSTETGGSLFGGGADFNSINGYRSWVRGTWVTGVTRSTADSCQWPIFNSHPGVVQPALRTSIAWHDGSPAYSTWAGFAGRWEVLAVQPTEATCTARGIGPSQIETSKPELMGGMKIAELLIFSEILCETDLRRVGTYLNAKWFSRPMMIWSGPKAYNGVANVGTLRATNKSASTVSVAAGETLNVDRLQGGRGATEVVKTGGGRLVLGDASDFGGTLTLEEGETVIPLRPVPAALPAAAVIDFDAEKGVTLTERNGTNYVTRWNNAIATDFPLSTGSAGAFGNVFLREYATDGTTQLLLREEPMLGGRKVVDFGKTESKNSGLNLPLNSMWMCNASTEATMGENDIAGFQTFVWVVGAQEGGGMLFGKSNRESTLQRSGRAERDLFTYPIRFQKAYGDATYPDSLVGSHTNALLYVNGVRRDISGSFETPGYQVAASHDVGHSARFLCQMIDAHDCGGMRLAEVVGWRRILDPEELKDAQAYLAAKWMDKRLPGYADPKGRTVELIGRLAARPGAVLKIDGEGTVRVREVSGSLRGLVKTGAGTLELPATADSDAYAGLVVREGLVKFYGNPTVSAKAERAAGAMFRVDATELASMKTLESGGVTYVQQWHDADGNGRAAYNLALANCPWLNTTDLCNGHPVVDFGPFLSGNVAGKRLLHFNRSLDGIRAIYVVLGSQNGGGILLGSSTQTTDDPGKVNNSYREFCRNGSGGSTSSSLFHSIVPAYVTAGDNFVDGARKTSSEMRNTTPSGGYQLFELHPTEGGAHVSAFAADAATALDSASSAGGQRLGEVILYDRVLSEREKVATRNYLMKKWFGKTDEELTPLPEEEPETVTYDTLAVSDGDVLDVSDVGVKAHAVVGDGTVVVNGSKTFKAVDMSGFVGTLLVSNATMRLTGRAPRGELAVAASANRIAHYDAGEGLLLSTNAAGLVKVEKWTSKVGDGWYAEPMHGGNGDDWKANYLAGNGKDVKPAVQMLGPRNIPGATDQAGPSQCLVFRDGVNEGWGLLTNIYSVVWVIGAQEGGGYVLGGGYPNDEKTGTQHYNWSRGGEGLCYDYTQAICEPRESRLNGAKWWLDGTAINPRTTGYGTPGYHLLSVHTVNGLHSNAEGFSFDGRDVNNRNGYQRLQEVIIFNKEITDAEREQTEDYLAWKWRLADIAEPAEEASVVLASATLDLNATTNTLAGFGGSGELAEGKLTVTETYAVDGLDAAGIDVAGELVIADGVQFVVTNAEAIVGQPVVLARPVDGGAIALGEGCKVVGLTDRQSGKIRLINGELVLTVKERTGLMLIVR